MKAHFRANMMSIEEALVMSFNMVTSAETFTTIYDLAIIFHILKEKFYLTDELLGELFKEYKKLEDEGFLMDDDKDETEQLDSLLNYIKTNFKLDLEKDGYICSDDDDIEEDEEDSNTKCVTYDISN